MILLLLPFYDLDWLKIPFLCSVLPSIATHLFPPNLFVVALIVVAVYFRRDIFALRCFVPAVFIWDYFSDTWRNHGTFDLGRLVLLWSIFFSSFMLTDCEHSAGLHWFSAVTLRQMLLDLIKHVESFAFDWNTRQIPTVYSLSRSVHFWADVYLIFDYLLAEQWMMPAVKVMVIFCIISSLWILS